MAKPYDNDLRQKVIQAIKRTAETGDIQPKKRNFSQSKQKISDLDAFRQFADQHQDRTQAEMAQLWEAPVSS